MNYLPLSLGRSLRLPALIALVTLTLLAPVSLAQTPVSEAQMGDGPHPAHIHNGTCDQLGDVAAPLTDVAAPDEATIAGPATAHAVKASWTVVEMPLQEIIDGGHAINVHLSARRSMSTSPVATSAAPSRPTKMDGCTWSLDWLS